MPIISAHEDQHHICQHIYIYIYVYVFDLHGPRHIQKTRPKLIAIEPKLIAIPSEGMSMYYVNGVELLIRF